MKNCFAVQFLGKVPSTRGNKGSLKSCLHMVAMITSIEKNFVPALVALCSKKKMSAHYYDNYNQSMGKVHLIYETMPFKGCLHMVA